MPPRLPSGPVALDASGALKRSLRPAAAAASFSTSSRLEKTTDQRFNMHGWLNRMGNAFQDSDRPSYLGPFTDQPFPSNPLFRSQPVLSEVMKNIIYKKVMTEGQAMKSVSQEMGVDVRRIAAVIRLKQVEKRWEKEGKRLATPYAKAVMDMLPQSKWFEGEENQPHEPINDVTVHKLSVQQLFVPVAESRHFTREDAAKAFHEDLLSADDRSPHKQLIVMERELAAAKDPNDREAREKALEEYRNKTRKEEDAYAKQIAKKAAQEEAATTRVMTDRCEFRVKEINADDVGRTGRSRRGVGWRYGAPLQDRKRGQIKIPTSVP